MLGFADLTLTTHPWRPKKSSSNWFNNFIRKGGHKNLTLWILVAIIAAVALAVLAPEVAMLTEFGGELFLNLLKMMVVPLVITSVMSGIFGMGDVRKLGKPGGDRDHLLSLHDRFGRYCWDHRRELDSARWRDGS